MSRNALFAVLFLVATGLGASASAQSIPKPLKARFVTGDPVWRELPVRSDLQEQYEKCWQTTISTILENNYDIATMDKDSGYIRTTWNEGVVTLGGNWYYKVQVSIKFVFAGENRESVDGTKERVVSKVRLQVAGELSETKRGGLRNYYRGYDQVILQNLLQDFQLKLGS